MTMKIWRCLFITAVFILCIRSVYVRADMSENDGNNPITESVGMTSVADVSDVTDVTAVTDVAGEVQQEIQTDLKLYAQSAVLMDVETGRILYGKDADTKRPMASTTKIMTCILALEFGNMEDEVKVSSYAASMPDVQMGIRQGETYRLEDLMYSLMLESHNDSAVAIAEHIGETVEGFADMMNQKARDIGCENTCFVTPNGLDGTRKSDGEPHSTTAADLARIMSYCISKSPKREEFLKITETPSRTIADISKKRSFYLGNHNAFLTMLPEAVSGKTGFTGGAGYCYVGAFEKDGKMFTTALLASGWPPHKTYKWDDMRKLSSYALKNYEYYDIFERNKTFPSLEIIDGKKAEVPLSLCLGEQEQTLRVLMRTGEIPDIRYEYPKRMKAPVKTGTAVGKADYSVNGSLIASYPIYTVDDAERIDMAWCIGKCLKELLF